MLFPRRDCFYKLSQNKKIGRIAANGMFQTVYNDQQYCHYK